MLAITVNNVIAVEHLIPADHHSQRSAAEALVVQDAPVAPAAPTARAVAVASPDEEDSSHPHPKDKRDAEKAAPLVPEEPLDVPPPVDDGTHGDVHVNHCHISRSSCAEQPVPSGPGQMLFAEPLLRNLELQLVVIDEVAAFQSALVIDTLTPPPQL
jgi:hypothetical protein